MDERTAELLYHAGVEAWMDRLSPSLARFGDLMGEPDPASDGWRDDVLARAALWEALLAEAQGTEAQARFAPFHRRLLAMCEWFAEAGREYRSAFLDLDAAAIERGDMAFEAGAVRLNRIRVEMLGPDG